MGLGERIAAKRQKSRKLVSVPEWGEDSPLEIYVSTLTCADATAMERKHKGWMQNMSIEAMVDLLIMKGQDRDENRLFSVEDKPFLMREPLALMMRISAEIVGSVITVEEQEKN